MTFKKIFLGLLALSLVLAVGCSAPDSNENDEANTENLELTIGLMPAVDSAPMFLAKEKGYFEELGLDLNIQIFNNGQDRQSALQTNSIDGAMTDFIAVVTNINGGFDIKATTMTSGKFPVLVKKDFIDKKDIKVGMMEVSVSNFLIDEWLGDKYNIEKVFINEIPARLEMLKTGNLDMGLFPEPVASMGELGGLEKKIYELKNGYCPDVMVFTGKALEEKEEAIKLFHQGYNKAIEDINSNENEAREILIEKLQLNPEIKDNILLPNYTKVSLPDDAYLENIINWVEEVLNQEVNVTPSDLTEGKFIDNDSN
ncbi:ABC transporter substrate-binding protein [Sporosalibacterium faouarense]|uniref:ABC transporter substrate-binding protein n=1 Tax=Sporosalibacterium faouarense TaxID=516123 RepID=UPI00141D2D11|nr:ABC transporter substrate-binding protein [Sporosalibacterium faouarense]MTI46945.1 ABC transporter substrate-binding protein [Bacillota bacterium]